MTTNNTDGESTASIKYRGDKDGVILKAFITYNHTKIQHCAEFK